MMALRRLVPVALALALALTGNLPGVATAAGSNSDSLMPVGVARIDITPEWPIRLSGYGRPAECEEISGRLWAKALALGNEERPAILLTVETIGVPLSMTDALVRRLRKSLDVDRARVAICATHTHTGPFVKGTLPCIHSHPMPADHQDHISRYADQLLDRLEQVSLAAWKARTPCRLAWTQGTVGFAMNRRVLADGQWKGFGVVPEGAVDRSLPLLRVTDAAGKLRAVLVSYACHCTTLTGQHNFIHGDWAGAAAGMIESEHPGTVAMIAVGCAADINPYPRGTLELAEQHGKELADAVKRLLNTRHKPITKPLSYRYQLADLPFADAATRAEWEKRAQGSGKEACRAKRVLAQGIPTKLAYPIQVWKFGDSLDMVFLAGEVVVDYSLRLKREIGRQRTWVNAYANDLPCYVASKRLLPEGGYEVDGSMIFYGRPSRFSEEAEELLVREVKKLAQ